MNADAASTVDPITTAPAPVLDTPETAPPAPPETTTDAPKPVSIREGIESSLKAIRDRPRDEVGRFAPTPAKQPDPATAATKAAPAPAQPAVVAPPVRPADMPKAWAADKAQHWAGMTPEQRAYVTERETQMEAFHAKHAGLGQWQEAAAANNTTLNEVLERVHTVETAMATDPAQGLIQACHMVGLDKQSAVAALAGALRNLGVQVGPSAQQPQSQTPSAPPQSLPPEVQQVLQRVQTLEGTLRERALSDADQRVQAFFADPANKYANELQNEISGELKAMRAKGEAPDLAKAYERAMWNTPRLREQIVADQVAQKQKEADAARAQELEKARSASRSVAGSPPVAEGRSSADQPSKTRDMIAQGVRNAMHGRA